MAVCVKLFRGGVSGGGAHASVNPDIYKHPLTTLLVQALVYNWRHFFSGHINQKVAKVSLYTRLKFNII